jgi:hypothetical protein
MSIVFCDKKECAYNEDNSCNADMIELVCLECITFEEREEE